MSALPRGSCPVCGRDVALRKGGLVREHRGDLCRCRHALSGHHRFRYNCLTPGCSCTRDELATCHGSGMPNGCNCSICEQSGVAFGPVCRGCGCTDDRACAGPCSWVTVDPAAGGPLCSACAGDELS